MSVDAALLGDDDFIAVRAALIAEVGAVEAIVLTRIHFRAREEYREAYERDGFWWWRAPAATIAAETGLTEKQVKRSLAVLRDAGHIVAEQHQNEGRYDRALSVRVDLDEGTMHRPRRADEDGPSRAYVPLLQEVQETPPTPSSDDEAFEAAWKAWPNSKGKKPARSAWNRLSRTKQNEIVPALVRHANAHRSHTPPQYIPMLSTWINQERWTDPLPVSRDRGVYAPEVEKPKTFTVPPGHRIVRDEMGHIIGTEPA